MGKYRVYDDRTNDTLFTSNDNFECVDYMIFDYGEKATDDDMRHIWMEEIESNYFKEDFN